jgi:TetR/AcrR family transcriptional regulator
MSRRPDPVGSRRAILEAARARFSAAGFAGTSMHDIATAAGITQSLIHHYFGSKDTLWAEIRRQAFEQHVARQRAVVDTLAHDPERLHEALAAYFRFLAERPDVLRLVTWLELDPPPELQAELRALEDHGVGVLQALQAQGRARRDQPARFVLVALLGLVRNWFEERNLVYDESDPREVTELDAAYLQALWTFLATGLLAPQAKAEALEPGLG